MTERCVPIEISARHVHLSQVHLEQLLGAGARLHVRRSISQPGQFAAEEEVEVVGPKGKLKARIVGPVRAETQIELSITDCHLLGIPVTIAPSGSLAGTAVVVLRGPAGEVKLNRGVLVPQRHLHINIAQAAAWGLQDGDSVNIKVAGKRAVTFHEVIVRARQGVDELSFMLDYDEANAANVSPGTVGILIDA